ncbi:MAG: glutathione S-transferase N-terminal domain-containing protein [Bradymonadaceae bacterium]
MSIVDDVHSFAASACRGARGMKVIPACREEPPRPDQPVEIFEFEACPYCRKVREVLSELDLRYVARTCPKGDRVTRSEVEQLGGKQQFPFLRDPNTGDQLYESDDIADYLIETYAPAGAEMAAGGGVVRDVTAGLASAVRPKGGSVRPGCDRRDQPDERLILYNFEISPFCRKVREALCELNLDYEVRNVAKKSARRPELVERGGQMMVPYLVDPNTDTEMYESDDIVAYLERTYRP